MRNLPFSLFVLAIVVFVPTLARAHSQLDYLPLEPEKHLHVPTVLGWVIVGLLGLWLVAFLLKTYRKWPRFFYAATISIFCFAISVFGSILITGLDQEEGKVPEVGFQASGNVVEIDVKSYNFGYEPNVIEVSAGDTVRIHIDNLDFTHTFSIYELGVNEILYPKSASTIEFVAFKKGEFPIFCAIEGHRISGMEGKIIVR